MDTKLLMIFFIFSFLFSKAQEKNDINYAEISTYTKSGKVNCVVEIPAGTSHKLEYNYSTNSFPCDQIDGKDRVISFIPFIGNYGFIPSTRMDESKGGDGDALDILVISESVPTGTVMEVKIIGLLQLTDDSEQDDKIIAIPADETKQVIKGNTISELKPSVQDMIKNWFLNYSKDPMVFKGWLEADEAKKVVEKWRKKI